MCIAKAREGQRPRFSIALPGPADGPPIVFASAPIDETDRFGLPLSGPGLLSSPEAHEANDAAVTALARDAFATAVRLLDSDRARKLFKAVSSGPRGAPRRARDRVRDERWLVLFDGIVASLPNGRPVKVAIVARKLKVAYPDQFRGNEAIAIAMHLGRLLQKRDVELRRQARYEVEMRRLGLWPDWSFLGGENNK